MSMTLLNDATSPFGRKIVVAAIERSVDLVEEFVDVYSPGPLDELNPLRQIPTLVTRSHGALYDSSTIMQFLDSAQTGPALIPSTDRWEILTRCSLGDGLIEATLQRVMELKRPLNERSQGFVDRMEERIWRALERIDASTGELTGTILRADQITIACALEYLDFRFSRDWRQQCERASAWVASVSIRPSMVATQPTRTRPIS